MFTVMKMAETRPSIAPGVSVWRKVVEVMVQTVAMNPNRKNDSAASAPCGHSSVATMVAEASTDSSGPSRMAWPKFNAAIRREASSAALTMPAPKHASVTPTALALKPSARMA